jgi:hypothetical protein
VTVNIRERMNEYTPDQLRAVIEVLESFDVDLFLVRDFPPLTLYTILNAY